MVLSVGNNIENADLAAQKVSVVCSDKTGTLTSGEMTAVKVFALSAETELTAQLGSAG